jgi:hypothetical protein
MSLVFYSQVDNADDWRSALAVADPALNARGHTAVDVDLTLRDEMALVRALHPLLTLSLRATLALRRLERLEAALGISVAPLPVAGAGAAARTQAAHSSAPAASARGPP